ncbi:hypothetical protein Tco_0510593 [Tanacetum coccineum]
MGAIPAVPDISGAAVPIRGPPSSLRSYFCLFVGNVVSGLEEEALVEFIVKWFEEDEDGKKNGKGSLAGSKREWSTA